MIAVGAYTDNDTGSRADDEIWSDSSYRNPVDADSVPIEKPDVVAVGKRVGTTNDPDGVDNVLDGTSLAAPAVSALAALIVSKQPMLRFKPEAVKAIIMAGATHNIADGIGYTDCPHSPTPGDCRDGAGAIDAYQTITNVVEAGTWAYRRNVTPSSFNANGNIDIPWNFSERSRARVVIAWDSTPVCTDLTHCTSDTMNADLDLLVLDPLGAVIAGSYSARNSAEVVDFIPLRVGNYIIRIRKSRFLAGTNTHLGVALNRDTRDRLEDPFIPASRGALTTGLRPINVMPNTTLTSQTNDKGPSFWDYYTNCGLGNVVDGPERIYRVTLTQPGRITASLTNIAPFFGVNSQILMFLLEGGVRGEVGIQSNLRGLGCSSGTLDIRNLPAGTYYLVVDGMSGSVAKTYDLTVNISATS